MRYHNDHRSQPMTVNGPTFERHETVIATVEIFSRSMCEFDVVHILAR